MNSFNIQEKRISISVVIPTLGDISMGKTIESLNAGSIVPNEIIICIPKENIERVLNLRSISNVKIIKTDFRGQVYQRAQGLAIAKSIVVMQSDDDILFPENCLEVLLNSLLLKGAGNIIAPSFKLKKNQEYATCRKNTINDLLRDLYATLICGARFGVRRYGTISKAGVGYGTLPHRDYVDLIESEWLPGGVTICFKTDLIQGDYYPFLGKAYSEDLIHSVLWRLRGFKLWVNQQVNVLIDVSEESFKIEELIARYKAHLYVAKLLGGNSFRTKLWFMCHFLKNSRKIIASFSKY